MSSSEFHSQSPSAPLLQDPMPNAPEPLHAPWSYCTTLYDDWGMVRDARGWVVCQARAHMDDDALNAHRRAKTDPCAERARLIAAAPALLEALENTLRALDMFMKDANWGASCLRGETIMAVNEAPGVALRAIALAKGDRP